MGTNNVDFAIFFSLGHTKVLFELHWKNILGVQSFLAAKRDEMRALQSLFLDVFGQVLQIDINRIFLGKQILWRKCSLRFNLHYIFLMLLYRAASSSKCQ